MRKDLKMKIGPRKPSIKKSIKARTTGKVKRSIKKATIPGYGKKGTGWIKDPKKAAYNKAYNKTTFGVNPLSSNTKKVQVKKTQTNKTEPIPNNDTTDTCCGCGCLVLILIILLFIFL